jgi:hypothetical protein
LQWVRLSSTPLLDQAGVGKVQQEIADARKTQDAFHSGNSSVKPAFIMSKWNRNGVEIKHPRKKIASHKTPLRTKKPPESGVKENGTDFKSFAGGNS